MPTRDFNLHFPKLRVIHGRHKHNNMLVRNVCVAPRNIGEVTISTTRAPAHD